MIDMLFVTTVEGYTQELAVRKKAEDQEVSASMKAFLRLHSDQIIELVAAETDLSAVKAIEVKTLFGLAPGLSRGGEGFAYLSSSMGMAGKLLFLLGRKRNPSYTFKERVGKRNIQIRVFL